MNVHLPGPLRPLLDVLSRDPSAELILRGAGADTTATLRVPDVAPRVFGVVDGALVAHLPEDDVGLPGHRLLAGEAVAETCLSGRLGEPTSLRLVAWRPARRAVVRVGLADGTVVWLKLFDRKGHRRAAAVFAALRAADLGASVCLPTVELPDLAAFAFATAPGIALRDCASSGDPRLLAVVGAALATFGAASAVDGLPTADFESCRRASLDMLGKATAVCAELEPLVPALAAFVPPPPPDRPGLVHGDLHDKQIFVHGDSVALIDLDGAAHGDVRFDHANLAEHLRLRELQQGGGDSGRAERMLTALGTAIDAPGLREFRAVVRARLCAVYALRPRWRALVERLRTETLELLLHP
jgi:hypothetical protein